MGSAGIRLACQVLVGPGQKGFGGVSSVSGIHR
jgi:hypothetical protein